MDQRLIDRFYRGECTPQEVKAVLGWFRKQETTPEQDQYLGKLWAQAEERQTNPAYAHEADSTWSRIEASIAKDGAPEVQGARGGSLPGREGGWGKWARIAAAIVLPLGFLWLVAAYYQNTIPAGRMVAVQAAPGERKTVQLPDGSTIVLSSGSEVTYREPFAAHRRDVTLEGEAFFEVAKDKTRPFVVKSGAIYTQALGTSFNIKYLPKDTAISVALATGLVKISRGHNKGEKQIARLVPGQQLVFSRKARSHAIRPYDAREVLGWKDGVLYFRKAGLEEVVSRLEDWYGVQVEVQGAPLAKMKNWSYTGEYVRQPLGQVLEGIGFVKKFSYKIKNNQVQLTFNNP